MSRQPYRSTPASRYWQNYDQVEWKKDELPSCSASGDGLHEWGKNLTAQMYECMKCGIQVTLEQMTKEYSNRSVR